MTTELTTNNTANTPPPGNPIGARLQSAREALGLDAKDAASQLRLNERIILMMETDCYSSDLPPTFVRGYLRAYGKLLQIPEDEIKQAIAPIKAEPSPIFIQPKTDDRPKVTSSHYFMQIFTSLLILTLISLVGTWWYSHNSTQPNIAAENAINLPADVTTTEAPAAKEESKLTEAEAPSKINATALAEENASASNEIKAPTAKTANKAATTSRDDEDEDDSTE